MQEGMGRGRKTSERVEGVYVTESVSVCVCVCVVRVRAQSGEVRTDRRKVSWTTRVLLPSSS